MAIKMLWYLETMMLPYDFFLSRDLMPKTKEWTDICNSCRCNIVMCQDDHSLLLVTTSTVVR